MLKTPGQVTGVFDDRTLTLWVDSDMIKAILGRADTVAKLEAAASAFAGGPRRVQLRVGTPPAQPAAAPSVGNGGPEKDPMDELLAFTEQYRNFKAT